MRYIKNIQPIVIVDETTGVAQAEQAVRTVENEETGKKEQRLFAVPIIYTGERFVKELLNQSPIWREDFNSLTLSLDIVKAFKIDKDQPFVMLDDEPYKKLLEAVKNPRNVVLTERGKEIVSGYGWDNFVLFQLVPWIQAIIDAVEEQPEFETTVCPST